MKGVVIYKSRYGATRRYAEWIASRLNFELYRPELLNVQTLNNADVIILGSSVYVGKLLMKSWIQQHQEILQKKRLFLFVVCGTSPSEKEETAVILSKNLRGELARNCQAFFLPGSLDIDSLTLMDKLAIRMAAKFEKDPHQKERMRSGYDEVKQENISALVQAVGMAMKPELQS